ARQAEHWRHGALQRAHLRHPAPRGRGIQSVVEWAHAKAQRREDGRRGMRDSKMTENQIASIIVDTAFKIHKRLGPGLLESVYEAVMARELVKRRLEVVRQKSVTIQFDDLIIDEGF